MSNKLQEVGTSTCVQIENDLSSTSLMLASSSLRLDEAAGIQTSAAGEQLEQRMHMQQEQDRKSQ